MSNKPNVEFSDTRSMTSMSSIDSNEEKIFYTHNQMIFIDTFCKQLDDLHSKHNALELKLVKRNPETVDGVVKAVEDNQGFFPKFEGRGIEISTGGIIQGAARLVQYLTNETIEKAAKRMACLFRTFTPVIRARIIEETGRYIAYRYQFQIKRLNDLAVRELALCAAYRAAEYITRADENLVVNDPGFISKLGATISDSIMGRTMAPKVTAELKDPKEVLIMGVIKGSSKQDKTPIGTSDGKQWQPICVFENTGIIIKDENHQLRLYTHERLTKNDDLSPKYGFCYGTKEEVENGNYQPDTTTTLEYATGELCTSKVMRR